MALDIDPLETIEELQEDAETHRDHARLNGFVAEMKLAEEGARPDPRAHLKALRDAAARRAEGAKAESLRRDPPLRTA